MRCTCEGTIDERIVFDVQARRTGPGNIRDLALGICW
jgi:hypothetical protein